MIHRLEQFEFNAWPALEETLYDGWVLRASGGYTGRANSVNVVAPSSEKISQKIEFCEEWYQAHGLPPLFRITPLAVQEDLDTRLSKRGYQRIKNSFVLYRMLVDEDADFRPRGEMILESADDWAEHYQQISGKASAHAPIQRQILNRITGQVSFITLCDAGQPVACGLGVLENGYLGVFSVLTAPSEWGKGWGAQLMSCLLRWARQKGGQHAYLQVDADNPPALRLYQKMGFTELYPYWYRIKE